MPEVAHWKDQAMTCATKWWQASLTLQQHEVRARENTCTSKNMYKQHILHENNAHLQTKTHRLIALPHAEGSRWQIWCQIHGRFPPGMTQCSIPYTRSWNKTLPHHSVLPKGSGLGWCHMKGYKQMAYNENQWNASPDKLQTKTKHTPRYIYIYIYMSIYQDLVAITRHARNQSWMVSPLFKWSTVVPEITYALAWLVASHGSRELQGKQLISNTFHMYHWHPDYKPFFCQTSLPASSLLDAIHEALHGAATLVLELPQSFACLEPEILSGWPKNEYSICPIYIKVFIGKQMQIEASIQVRLRSVQFHGDKIRFQSTAVEGFDPTMQVSFLIGFPGPTSAQTCKASQGFARNVVRNVGPCHVSNFSNVGATASNHT